jgi:hypothetical protein
MAAYVLFVLFSCRGKILNSICWSFRFINFYEPEQSVVCKQASSKHFRDVFYFHPFEPCVMNFPVDLCCYIVYDHIVSKDLSVNGAVVAMFYIREDLGILKPAAHFLRCGNIIYSPAFVVQPH